jgi:hypothetical protein
MMTRAVVALGSVILLAGVGCRADDNGDVRAGEGPGEASTGSRYSGTFTVLESTEHGPQLCSGVAESYPPQCSGPDIVGWDWEDAADAESASGTTWGSYEVTGTWDGERLTLTEPPGPPRHETGDDVDFTSPCPEPPGGWAVVDPATTNRQALDAADGAARARPDFAGLWVDQSINPASSDDLDDPSDEAAMNDPTKLVLNVRVTGDTAAAERDLRSVWGGALCVSSAERTSAELASIQQEIDASGDAQGSYVDEVNGTVEITVFVDDGRQADYDERYGSDTVVVTPLLQPVD